MTKQNWEDKINKPDFKATGIYHVDGAEYNVDEKKLISFIKTILADQRKEIVEEIDKEIPEPIEVDQERYHCEWSINEERKRLKKALDIIKKYE